MSDIAIRAESPLPAGEPPVVVIQPTRGLAALQVRALWHYRELLFFLVWRDVFSIPQPTAGRGERSIAFAPDKPIEYTPLR